MKKKEFLHNLVDFYGTATFSYQGKKCGVEPETENGVTTYCMWFGENWKDYTDVDTLMADPFFDGRSLDGILPEVEVWF